MSIYTADHARRYYRGTGILELIRRLRTEEDMSQREIMDYLNERGFVTSRGNPFNQPTVRRILKTHGIDPPGDLRIKE